MNQPLSPADPRLTAYALGAGWAGMVGVIFAAKTTFINPASFTFLESAMILSIVVLAAFGGRVTAARLARATGVPATQIDAALDELEWQRWLVADGRGYAFVAGIVERIIERDMLTPGQRRRMKDS
mgnify:CR=1 FL=1